MFFRKLIYGRNYLYLFIQDTLLKCFDKSDFIENEIFFNNSQFLYNFDNAVDKLTKEGLIEQTSRYVKITLDGRMKVKSGGFLGEKLRKRLTTLGAAVGIIAGFLAIIDYFFS